METTLPIVAPSGAARAALPSSSSAEAPAEGDPFAAVLARQLLPADAAAVPADDAPIPADAEAAPLLKAAPAEAVAPEKSAGGDDLPGPVPAPAADSQTLLTLAAWGQAVTAPAATPAEGEPASPAPHSPAVPATAAPVGPGTPVSAPSGPIASPGAAAAATAVQRPAAPAETGSAETGATESGIAGPARTAATPDAVPNAFTVASAAPAHPRGPTLSVAAPVASPGFADDFSRQVVWIGTRGVQSAELRLDPPELGPVRVTIQVSDDRASAVFNAQHPLTRDAIEAALPRLRDALAQAGVQLGSATVSAEGFGGGRREGGDTASAGGNRRGAEPAAALAPAPLRRGEGLIDLFA